jgi:hypothetical protein
LLRKRNRAGPRNPALHPGREFSFSESLGGPICWGLLDLPEVLRAIECAKAMLEALQQTVMMWEDKFGEIDMTKIQEISKIKPAKTP